jgi:hypothetical protein
MIILNFLAMLPNQLINVQIFVLAGVGLAQLPIVG